MSSDLLQRLLEVAVQHDQLELKTAHNAMIAALKAHSMTPTAQTVTNKNATRDDYEATLERLAAKYWPEERREQTGERFVNRKQALNWLSAQGYKISQGKFYQDVAAGFPVLDRDGSLSKFQVMQYGQQLDVAARAGTPPDRSAERDDLEIRKLRAEVEEKEHKARREDHRWMLKEDGWAAMAAVLSSLKDHLAFRLHEGVGVVVHLAEGEPMREPEVYEALLDIVGKAFNDVAEAKIDGIFAETTSESGEEHE